MCLQYKSIRSANNLNDTKNLRHGEYPRPESLFIAILLFVEYFPEESICL